MAIFNHHIEYCERWDEHHHENFVSITVGYDDAFNERRTVTIAFNDSKHKNFDIRRVRIAGRAVTGSVIKHGLVVDIINKRKILAIESQTPSAFRWIDRKLPAIGDRINLIESFHPTSGNVSILATSRSCATPGLVSMNILVLDDSLDMLNPEHVTYVNLFTGEMLDDRR